MIGSDTLVAYEGRVLGKPRSLKLLQGNTHQVYTGVTVIVRDKEEEITKIQETDVTFYPVDEKEIRAYVATGDPMDKAGSYAEIFPSISKKSMETTTMWSACQ